jgi:hypothetical protein
MLKMIRQWMWLFLAPVMAWSQTADSLTGELPPEAEYLVEELSGIYEEGLDAADIGSENSFSALQRIDLNNVDPFSLAGKIRLSPSQIQHLARYIQDYGPLLTVYELKAIQGFDSTTIQRILPLITLQPKKEKMPFNMATLLRQTNGTLLLRYGRILEPQQGYSLSSGETGRQDHYLGDPSRVMIRFQARTAGRISLGLLAEKDAGEQLFKGTQKQGFDHYKAFLAITPKKVLQSLIIGNYHLGFGQGLTISSSTPMTSMRGLYQPYKFTNPVRPNTSSSESGGFRGVAADFRTGKISWTLFFSEKKLDARVDPEDSVGQILGWITSGYHRTMDEIARRNSVRNLIYGGHATFRNHYLQAGITCFHSSFQPAMAPPDRLYKRFMDPGGTLTVLGTDFRILLPEVVVFGEVSYRAGEKAGMIAGLLWYASARFKHTLAFRNYPSGFYHPYSAAPGKHQPNNNEKGFSWSFEAMLSKKLTTTGGANMFWHPWVSYRMDKPCTGSEFYLFSSYKPAVNTQLIVRFIYNSAMQNRMAAEDVITSSAQISSFLASAQLSCKTSPGLTLKSQLYITVSQIDKMHGYPGYLFSADIHYKPVKWPMDLIMRYALFDTRSYSDRIYAYERDVLYAFSAPAYYSKGIRFYVMLRYGAGKWLDVWIRFARSHFTDQATISSGSEEILASHKSEVKVQLRYRF